MIADTKKLQKLIDSIPGANLEYQIDALVNALSLSTEIIDELVIAVKDLKTRVYDLEHSVCYRDKYDG